MQVHKEVLRRADLDPTHLSLNLEEHKLACNVTLQHITLVSHLSVVHVLHLFFYQEANLYFMLNSAQI